MATSHNHTPRNDRNADRIYVQSDNRYDPIDVCLDTFGTELQNQIDLSATIADLELSRYYLLKDACSMRDTLYLDIHKLLFSMRKNEQECLYPFPERDRSFVKQGLAILDAINVPVNLQLSQHAEWFSSHPRGLTNYSPEYLASLCHFLKHFPEGWRRLMSTTRGFTRPPTVYEMTRDLGILSRTLRKVVFIHIMMVEIRTLGSNLTIFLAYLEEDEAAEEVCLALPLADQFTMHRHLRQRRYATLTEEFRQAPKGFNDAGYAIQAAALKVGLKLPQHAEYDGFLKDELPEIQDTTFSERCHSKSTIWSSSQVPTSFSISSPALPPPPPSPSPTTRATTLRTAPSTTWSVKLKQEETDFLMYHRWDQSQRLKTVNEKFWERFGWLAPQRIFAELRRMNQVVPICDSNDLIVFADEHSMEPQTQTFTGSSQSHSRCQFLTYRYPERALTYEWVNASDKEGCSRLALIRREQLEERKRKQEYA